MGGSFDPDVLDAAELRSKVFKLTKKCKPRKR